MGQTILNSIGAFAEDGTPSAEGEAPPTEGEAPPVEGQAPPAEDEPEGEATPVAEVTAAQEEPVKADPETADHLPPTTEDEETSGGEAEQAETAKAGNLLPDGFIAIDMNGRTPDGSVPFFILKKQLDRMR